MPGLSSTVKDAGGFSSISTHSYTLLQNPRIRVHNSGADLIYNWEIQITRNTVFRRNRLKSNLHCCVFALCRFPHFFEITSVGVFNKLATGEGDSFNSLIETTLFELGFFCLFCVYLFPHPLRAAYACGLPRILFCTSSHFCLFKVSLTWIHFLLRN